MKLLSLLMALLLALTTLTAFAEDEFIGSVDAETMTVATLSGYVLDVQEELLLVKTPDGLYVEALLTEETASEGADVLVGDFVHILYNGMMTRSLPAQITAEHIRTQVLTGVITEVTEDGFMVVDDNGILTFVHVSEATRIFTELAVDAAIRVTTDGTATMSLPAQVTAIEVLPAEEAAETAEEPVIEG